MAKPRRNGGGRPLTDEERARIVELLPTGKTCRQIADEVGRSRQTVSKIARAAGHVWGEVNQARARAVEAYGAERRAATATRLHQEADLLLEQLHQPHLVWNIGGKDNVYTEHLHGEPDVGAKHTMIRAAREAMRTVLDIDKHDNRSTDVDQAAGLIVQLVDNLRSSTPDAA